MTVGFAISRSDLIIIPMLVPLALKGVAYKPMGAGPLLARNLAIYGLGGLVAPFIGIKLIMEALSGNSLPFINSGHPVSWVPEVPTWLSLLVIVLALGGSAVASVLKMKQEDRKEQAQQVSDGA